MVRRMSLLSGTALVLLALAPPLVAQTIVPADEPRYFYKGLGYGSDASFHPVSEVINGAFGILQISSNWVPLDEIDWSQGFDVTWRSISHPGRTIDAYGRQDFLMDEMLPARLDWNNLQWVPNYTLHMIGGGARNRAFAEWYGAHGFAAPAAWAFGTTMAHAFAVEAVEHHAETVPTVDPVADMLFFDPVGALLFMNDGVSNFFANTLHLSIWSGQPMYNPSINTFENAGENYGLHYFFHDNDRVGIFAYMGMSHLFGVTVRSAGPFDWSVGVGGAVDELNSNDRGNGTSSLYARLKLDGGVFLHRNGSLLASVQASQAWTQAFRLTVYPGVFSPYGLATGFYTGVRGDDVIVGLSLANLPVGLAVSQRR